MPFLEKMGITCPQYLFFMVLWKHGNLSMNEIGEKLLLNTNTLSPLIKRLEKLNLLDHKRSTQDERSLRVELTEKGKDLKYNASEVPQ
tara:strand:- start:1445 stop:1708 length:264 start_codon:yes stop_codon:yes gene_type:complete